MTATDDGKARLGFQLDRFAAALAALQDAVTSDTGDKKSRDSILLSFVFSQRAVVAFHGLMEGLRHVES